MDGNLHKQMSDIALAAAKEGSRQTLNEVFALLGVNLSDFEDVKAFREDIEFVRRIRSGGSKLGAKFVLTVVSVVAATVAISSWEYIKTLLHIH